MNRTCRDVQDRLAEMMISELPADERDALERHLDACPDCRAFRQSLGDDDRLLAAFAHSMGERISRLEEQVMKSMGAAEERVPETELERRGRRAPSIWRFALAAAAVVAAAAGYYWMTTNHGIAVAWADVLAQVESAQDYICRRIEEKSADPDLEMVEYRSAEYGLRQEIYKQGRLEAVQFVVPAEKMLYAIMPGDEAYMRQRLTAEQVAKHLRDGNAREIVAGFRAEPFTELGRRRIDGVQASGIEVTNPSATQTLFDEVEMRLWVDIETNWPVRIEVEGVAAGGAVRNRYVLEEFEWNPSLSAADFAVEIPDDYSLIADLAPPDASEAGALRSLRVYAEVTGGRFPGSLVLATAIHDAEVVWERHRRYDRRAGADLEAVFEIRNACQFYAELVDRRCDPLYAGETVSIDDPDRILLRWRLETGAYRIIYGDLRTETVDGERLRAIESRQRPARIR